MTRIMDAFAARMDRIRKGDKGFTLIELLVVVIIIGILAAIAIPVYIGVQNNAKESAVKSDLGNLKTAEVANYTNTNAYVTGNDFTSLSKQGYSQSDGGNYTTAPVFTQSTVAGNTSGFCIAAVASTGAKFAVSDLVSLKTGTCSAAGVFVP